MGKYVIRSVQYFVKNKPLGIKEIFDLQGTKIIEEEYFSHTDTISYKSFYPKGQLRKVGESYKDRKFGIWKSFSESGNLEKECEYEKDHKSGRYKEFYPNGIVKVEGRYKLVIQEGEKELIRFDMLRRKEIKTKEKLVESVKEGKWIYRDEQGNITKTETFEDE